MPPKNSKSNHKSPLILPISFGLKDGSNAHLLVDASGEVFGNLFGIPQGLSVPAARKSPLAAKGVRTAAFVTHAVNTHDALVLALKKIYALPQKRTAAIAGDALTAAGEI